MNEPLGQFTQTKSESDVAPDEFIKNAIEFYIRERQRSKKKIFRFRFRSNTKESLGSADVGVVFPLKVHSHPVKANAKAVKFPS